MSGASCRYSLTIEQRTCSPRDAAKYKTSEVVGVIVLSRFAAVALEQAAEAVIALDRLIGRWAGRRLIGRD